MHKERMQQLRDHIAALPEGRFSYPDFLMDERESYAPLYQWIDGVQPKCGTIGCVAGHCVMLFDIRKEKCTQIDAAAAGHLELDGEEAEFLFYEHIEAASREDALKRMDWLLKDNPVEDYPWHLESWKENS